MSGKVIPGIYDLEIIEGANIDDTFVIGHTNKDLQAAGWEAYGFETGSNASIFTFSSTTGGSGLTVNSSSATETNLTLSATSGITDAYDFEDGYWYLQSNDWSGGVYRFVKGKIHFNRKNS